MAVDKMRKHKSYEVNERLLSILLDRRNATLKASHLVIHIDCKSIVTSGLIILIVDRTPPILVSNCTWSHINTGRAYAEKSCRPVHGTPGAKGLKTKVENCLSHG